MFPVFIYLRYEVLSRGRGLVKHNISFFKNLIVLAISISYLKISFAENKFSPNPPESKIATECTKFVARNTRNFNNHDKATYKDSQGHLYISQKAFVHGGKPVNTKKFLAPELIEQVGDVGTSESFIIIDKFLHNNHYYKAKFSLDEKAIQTSFLQTMPFPIVPGVMAGHVQARFIMNPGYEIELLDPQTLETVEAVKDMIVSYEAVLPIDGSYNFALGAVDSSPLVGRIVSGAQKLSEGPDRAFNQFKLPLSGQESAELLFYYLNDSIKIKMDLFYNTIIRNCTTTIFDGIDSLKRFKTKIEQGLLSPFLTTIGGDPVIGPAVNGLLERFGSELEHVQDMKDEYKNIYQSYGVPKKIEHEKFPFAPGSQDPMTLLVMTLGTENLTDEERKVVEYVVDDIIHDLPETMNMFLGSAFSMVEDLQSSPQMIQAITDVISKKLRERRAELGDSIPTKQVSIQVQFTPYPSKGQGTDLRSQGLRAQLPFLVQKIEVTSRNQKDVFSKIQTGIEGIDAHVEDQIPAFLKNFSVHIQLQKENTKVTSQFLIGLQPTLKSVEIVNDQIAISEFEVPKAEDHEPSFFSRLVDSLNPWAEETQPPFVNMLLVHEQNLEDTEANPIAKINFGPDINIQKSGQMEMTPLTNSRYVCWSGAAPHTPMLSGTLNDTPLSGDNWFIRQINKVLKGRNVTLSITELEMNLKEMNIKTTKLRVGVLGFRCLDIESVNQQFGAEANAKLQELINKVGPASIVMP